MDLRYIKMNLGEVGWDGVAVQTPMDLTGAMFLEQLQQ